MIELEGWGMESGLWLLLVVGAVLGFYLGRWRAENKRARVDMERVWDNRRSYREG